MSRAATTPTCSTRRPCPSLPPPTEPPSATNPRKTQHGERQTTTSRPWRCTAAPIAPTPSAARSRCRSTRRPPTSSRTPATPRGSSRLKSSATSTPASRTRRWDALEDAHRGARRRRGGARGRLGADGLRLFGAEPRPGRRQHRLVDRSLWRHVDAVRADAEAVRHRGPLRRSERSRELPPRDRRQDARLLRRDPPQPEAPRLPDPRGRRHRPLARRSA